MAAFATYGDLEAFWRPLSAAEQTRATTLLGYASALIRSEWPDIDARLALVSPDVPMDPNLPKLVAVSMVKRALMGGTTGGEGVTQQSMMAGPFQQQATYANPQGNLYLSNDEKRLLSPGGTRRKAFSINMVNADTTATTDALGYWDWDRQA